LIPASNPGATERETSEERGRPDLALIVLTHDEEPHLARCLESVGDLASAIYVVDSGSCDRTLDIARRFTDHVAIHPFTNQAEQFNWALDTLPCDAEWVLRLDADEVLLPPLRDEIARVLPTVPEHVTGLAMKRRMVFQGRWIRHGGIYPMWLLRLFRYGHGRAEELEMDEHIVLLDGEAQRLEHDFADWNLKDLDFWTRKHIRYAAREARVLERHAVSGRIDTSGLPAGDSSLRYKRRLKGSVYARSPLFLRALAYFLYRYVIRGGYRDGTEGLIYHVLQAFWYRFYADVKVWEGTRQSS